MIFSIYLYFICLKFGCVMFLLSRLCNQYFIMITSFRTCLVYLLMIIPQYGNSPIPVMESWLQKDQDDGFVERDMTSSLTGGDESFGSAHQTYQNSLIRKKKSDSAGNVALPAVGYRKFTSKYNRNDRFEQPNAYLDKDYMSNNYNPQEMRNEKNDAVFEDFEPESGTPNDKFNPKSANLRSPNDDTLSPRLVNKFSSGIVPSKDILFYNKRMANPRNEESLNEGLGRNSKWALCRSLKERYAPNPQVGYQQSIPLEDIQGSDIGDNNYFQENYPTFDERINRDVNNKAYKEASDVGNRPELKNPAVFDESQFYEVEAAPGEGDAEEEDYNQFSNDHAYLQKRDETRQNANNRGPSETVKVNKESLKVPDQSRSFTNDAISLEAIKEDLAKVGNNKIRDTSNPNGGASEITWKVESGPQTKALHDVMRNAQNALQEIQPYQQRGKQETRDNKKRENKQESLLKCDKKNVRFEDSRLKREDEDEQKNMKTGTDEGGGGEYEDEEGKGHKDEEEYYEDADLSDNESGNEVRNADDLNQKYYKRETAEKTPASPAKEQTEDNNPQEYELSLDNAPVENAGKSKKSSLHGEGEKTKQIARKGVKIWDEWGKWSACSVTCGVGRSTRWRHCIGGGCAKGEKEAQIRRCTNPAC